MSGGPVKSVFAAEAQRGPGEDGDHPGRACREYLMAKGQTVRPVCGVIIGYPGAGYSKNMGNHAHVQSSNTKFFEQGELVESSSSCCC